jgi:hypothetical protein
MVAATAVLETSTNDVVLSAPHKAPSTTNMVPSLPLTYQNRQLAHWHAAAPVESTAAIRHHRLIWQVAKSARSGKVASKTYLGVLTTVK